MIFFYRNGIVFPQKLATKGGGQKIVKELRINERIKAKEVRLIGETGTQVGVVPLAQALRIAKERGFDLVEIVPISVPPVCRLLNYGKYKYEQTKKERKLRKGQRAGLLKEIRLRPRIKEHDLEAKVRIIKKLLDDGDKVRISLVFRGREVVHPERGWKILEKVVEDLKGVGVVDGSPTVEETNMFLTFSPASQAKEVKVVKGV